MHYFIHIPKTGGQSLLSIAWWREDKKIINVGHENGYMGHARALWNKYPNSFTFIRNPYDRLVSAYFYYVKNKDRQDHLPIAAKIIEKYPTFEKFVMGIDRDGLMMDSELIHIKPMYYWIGTSEKILVEKIFKIEEPKFIDDFLFSIGIDQRLSDVRENTSIHNNYMEYMTREIIDEINKLYVDDFKLFNYRIL